jgi:hypothetical protein
VLLLAGCSQGLSLCSAQSDVSGNWSIAIEPPLDGGGIPRADTLTAVFDQQPGSGLSFGRLLWGSFVSDDHGFFDEEIFIPRLQHNNGSKTGSLLGCTLSVNVPLTVNASDDNSDPGPIRLSLQGYVTALGQMVGRDDRPSTVILDEDPSMTPQVFTWTARQF